MTAVIESLEQRLTEAYFRQSQCYDRALAIVAERGDDADFDPWIADLQSVLQEIAAFEAGMTGDKSLWWQSGRVPGPQLRRVLDATAERIRRLAALVDRRMEEIKTRRARWLPDLDGFIRQRQMLHSYAQHAKEA